MREVSRDMALYLFCSGEQVYGLCTDGTEALLETPEQIINFSLFGVEE